MAHSFCSKVVAEKVCLSSARTGVPTLKMRTRILVDTDREKGILSRVIEMKSHDKVQELSPSPYGVFHVLLDGRL